MTIAILYALFACLSTASNIAVQAIAVRAYPGPYSIPLSVACGTAVGLVVKYALDKRWIFRWKAKNVQHDAGTFLLYTSTGVFTTAIFWGSEFLFQHHFHTEAMRYVGAVVGLAIGYVTKYRMDKAFVFAAERASERSHN
ncbi:GtrA family protein [Paraburkholderia phosphatilytica]|uniref:GtrA family protein n=1 Tax=Paraburkholderia phosphatilytica TaxID=2282883 RepID=UPI000E4A21FE|nr:GtrA family protein [Paraburkholderia phosphatilytica]